MNKEKTCPICNESKKKRSCKLQQDELICISCCLKKQSYYCDGCSFYHDKILKFKCVSCGKTSIDDLPSDITKLMGAKIFRLENLEGNNFDNRFVDSGETYTTSIEFPFEGKTNTPIWFYYDSVNQIDDLLDEIDKRISSGGRVLVTTLTKRMAEDLTDYLTEQGIRVRYLHSDVETLERLDIIRDLRAGRFDVLVGINLLREGLDLPEVALVVILDADREGFLRSETALIQTIGRAARNIHGRVLMYADKETRAVGNAVKETNRRRSIQKKYNRAKKITPRTIKKAIYNIRDSVEKENKPPEVIKNGKVLWNQIELHEEISRLEKDMLKAAKSLEFEQAAEIRDQIKALKQWHLKFG